MNDRVLDACYLESGDDLIEELAIHPHRISLSVRLIQMGQVGNMPVASLFCQNKPSRLIPRNTSHCRCCFMSGAHLKMAVRPTEGIRFIIGEESHLSRSLVDDPDSNIVWVLGDFPLNMSNLRRITRCVVWSHSKLPNLHRTGD